MRGPYIAQGEPLTVSIVMNNRLNAPISVTGVSVNGFDTAYKAALTGNKNFAFTRSFVVAADKPITQPYWLESEMSPGSFNVRDLTLIGDPQSKPAYDAVFRLTIDGTAFVFTRPLMYKFTDPVKGELYQPLTVLPPMTARFEPELVLFMNSQEKGFQVETRNQTGHALAPQLQVAGADGISVARTGGSEVLSSWSAQPSKK